MNKLFKTVSLTAALGIGLSQGVVAKETIVLGEVSWDAGRAIQSVLAEVMEQHLDVNTEIMAVDQAVIFKAMDAGKGAIDVHPDFYLPAMLDKWEKYIAKGSAESILVNDQPYEGGDGFYIPGYIQDEYDVHSVYDLQKPEIAALFDSDGDGTAEYWPGAPGWGVTNAYRVKAKGYGFADQYTPITVSDSILKALLKTAYRKQEGILFYYWTPEWIHMEYDLRKLEEPAFTGFAMASKKGSPDYNADGCWNMVPPSEDLDWLENSSITCASKPPVIHVGYSESLNERAPRVAQFLKQVNFDVKQVSGWVRQIGKEGQDPVFMAREWIAENPEIVKGWLKGV
ncbi:MAG: glycine betaine/proline transport system substrate-binding protein [Motiliproteus sp.]|jgi:glycine betaine/proline transport system substrate-binding protein